MSVQAALEQREQVVQFLRKHRIGLLTLLFTDIVGSTQLKHDLGDAQALLLLQRHHALVRKLLRQSAEAEEISTAGDSFFIVFAKPSEAVKFALLLQAWLRELASPSGVAVLDRVGIHLGEVFIAEGEGPKDLYGLQVDICARVMSLAEGGQVLLTRSPFDNARQVLKGQELPGLNQLAWLHHGPYVLKGLDEPLDVYEVGEVQMAPLKAPPNTEKAHRYVSPDQEPVLGWRPALGQSVPGTSWVLEEKLGEGGFGEVWLGRHQTLKEQRVFKFCFRADRVRSLRREVTLFRVLKEQVGEHANIVGIKEVFFGEPPYYLEMEYVGGRDLRSWCERQGGVGKVPLATRLEIVAQVAEGLQAAHAAGVIHRDVKPSNILISGEGRTAKLTDFGIGQVVSAEYLDGMTRAGFTQTMLGPGFSGQSGTQMYLAPELIAGKPASARSDIYSLGVVLYQLLAGDFNQPLTTDWAARIADPLLKEDLLRCFAGDPQARFASARDLAGNLRSLKERQAALAAQKAALDALAQLRAAAATSQRFVFLTRSLKAIAYFAALAAFSFFAAFLAFMVAGAQSLDFVAHATHCRLNLKIIDQAKRQWALDKQKSAGAAVDTNAVLAYIEGGMPVCLSGGKYALNDVGVAPSCNLREHLADQDFKRLRLAVPYAFPIKPVEGPVRLTLAAAASSAAALGGVGVVLLLVRLYREKLGQRSKADPGVVPAADLVLFTRQLATMLDAGFGVSEALQALWGQIPREATRAVIKDVGLRVEQGTSFSAALQEHPGVFDQAFCCIVEAAEKGGTLCEAMARLAGQLENAARLRRKVRSGLAFPAMLACAAIWATAFLLVKMVPMLGEQFARLGRQLPKPTQDLISLCNWVQGNYLYPIAIVAAVLCGWLAIIKSNAGRAFWDWFRIKLPILGPLALKLALSRFARTAASLLRSGLPAAEALRLSGHAVRNRPLEAALRAAASDVERGDSISMALGKHPIFPGLIVRLLAPAEQTGMVQGMLERLADLLDEEVEAVLSNFASFIESLFLVFLAIMLGALAISMSLPVIQLDEVLSPR